MEDNRQLFFDRINLESVSRTTIATELFEKMRTAILDGALPPGYVFPNENDLCQKLNIGRTTLREAYSSLETLNLITRRKTGTCVNAPSEINTYMNFSEIARNIDTETLMEYRKIIEVAIIRDAAGKVTEEDLVRLQELASKMKTVREDPYELSQYDFDFHAYIASITGNRLLQITFNTIRGIYEDFTQVMFDCGAYDQSLLDHQNIVDSLKLHDSAKACEAMYHHLNNVQTLFLSL